MSTPRSARTLRTTTLALLTLPLLILFAGVTAGPAAAADPVTSAINAFQSGKQVYVDTNAEGKDLVDVGQVNSVVSGTDILVAVLPSSVGNGSEIPSDIGKGVGGRHTVIALVGPKLHADSNVLGSNGGGVEQKAAQAEAAHRSGGFTKEDVTAAITQLASEVKAREASLASGSGSSRSSSGGNSSSSPSSSSGSGSGGAIAVGVILLLVVGGVGFFVFRRRQRRKAEFADAKAQVDSLYQRLGNDVLTLDPAGDQVTGQALADAAERYNAAGSALTTATTVDQLRFARQTAIEGLHAARVARERLGLDPGPDIPSLGGAPGKSLEAEQEIAFQDKQYRGYPSYQPGAPYYYGGGTVGGGWVPGGWYSTPFWEPFLLGAVLSGGFGGGWGGGGYGTGYDQGFDRGYDEAQQNDQNNSDWGGGGGDWGGGGGGDWGGGGGDWGGGGGGGDWGGGGGDSGGGGW